ncbi:unnamed protein product [Toxocara canis]|uniref:PIP49_C domain-containing protein n=1 Tax=Toxocara canis TaxID=6265 RepID=A0A183UPA0_TOXCA|nr:unnamed protein product [Toxocara canis]
MVRYHCKKFILGAISGLFVSALLGCPYRRAKKSDCQVQRMMSSYTATCFWLYGTNVRHGLLINWSEDGISWERFKHLYSQHFRVNAEVKRGFVDSDFDLLKFKLQCHDCESVSAAKFSNSCEQRITFKNMLCPHLRYESGSTSVRFSVWRGMLELLQIFQDQRTTVRQLWQSELIFGFLDFRQVLEMLKMHDSTMCMRLSFITGGSVCVSINSSSHSVVHLEPLDLKRLQAKSLLDYVKDIAAAEMVKYILNVGNILVPVAEVLSSHNVSASQESFIGRDICSNVEPLSDDYSFELEQDVQHRNVPHDIAIQLNKHACGANSTAAMPMTGTSACACLSMPLRNLSSSSSPEFIVELRRLMAAHGMSVRDVIDLLNGGALSNAVFSSSCHTP